MAKKTWRKAKTGKATPGKVKQMTRPAKKLTPGKRRKSGPMIGPYL